MVYCFSSRQQTTTSEYLLCFLTLCPLEEPQMRNNFQMINPERERPPTPKCFGLEPREGDLHKDTGRFLVVSELVLPESPKTPSAFCNWRTMKTNQDCKPGLLRISRGKNDFQNAEQKSTLENCEHGKNFQEPKMLIIVRVARLTTAKII